MWTEEDQRLYNVAYYAEHRDEELERVRRREQATVAFLRDVRRRPCADCGGTFPPWIMDFDHRDPAQKSFSIAAGKVLLKSRELLLAEIAKCDIVCANCHAARTYRYFHSEESPFRRREPGTSPRVEELRARRISHRELLRELREKACADCGQHFPHYVMQFDHRDPATKHYVVTQMVGRAGKDRILAEAAKCDIVCSNCHRMRTYVRRQATRLEARGSSSVR